MKRVWLILLLWMAVIGPVQGQIVVLGKTPDDKALTVFFNQNGNANTVIGGLNSYATTPLVNSILPLTLSGKIYSGILDGTNNAAQRFVLRTWDTNQAALQAFEFTLNAGLPVSTNTVSRIGYPETNLFKTLDQAKYMSNGVFQTGVQVAQGSVAARTVLGLTQTNRLYIQRDWAWTTPTNYIEVQYGVVTAVQ